MFSFPRVHNVLFFRELMFRLFFSLSNFRSQILLLGRRTLPRRRRCSDGPKRRPIDTPMSKSTISHNLGEMGWHLTRLFTEIGKTTLNEGTFLFVSTRFINLGSRTAVREFQFREKYIGNCRAGDYSSFF